MSDDTVRGVPSDRCATIYSHPRFQALSSFFQLLLLNHSMFHSAPVQLVFRDLLRKEAMLTVTNVYIA